MTTRRNVILGSGAVALAAGSVFGSTLFGPSYEDAARAVWAERASAHRAAVGGIDRGYLVHYATRAANSHNTQPWIFSLVDNGIRIAPDFSRRTPVADADDHHLFASLGCAAENLVLAASQAGLQASARFVAGDGGMDDGWIEIGLVPGEPASDRQTGLFQAILERQCTRTSYDGRPVGTDDLKALEIAARVDGCRVVLISDKTRIEQALELIVAANTIQVEDPKFAAELLSWLRFNPSHAIERKDGLYGGCSGNPDLPSWLGNLVFGFMFAPQSENARYAEQIRSSAGLAVFVSDRDDKAHWVQAGRSCQRFALQATALGIRHAFVNQPLEVASIRPQVAAWLGLADQRPDLIVRYGYAPAMPHSLRRITSEVIA